MISVMQLRERPASGRSQLIAGQPTALGMRTRRIIAPNAGMMTGPGTNTYLLGTREVVVLDPGPDDDAHLQAILAASESIRWIVTTHTHRDHSPLAARLARETGASRIGLPAPDDGRQDETFHADHVPSDGERLRLGDIALTVVHTPGHASNCVCYLLEGEPLLFTGDHVLEGVSPVILPPDGDMSAYLKSLEKLLALDFEYIAPGHGALMEGGKNAVESLRAHRLAREVKVLRSLRAVGAATLERLTPVVYDDVAPDRHSYAKLTLEAHLLKLLREGRVIQSGESWQVAGSSPA